MFPQVPEESSITISSSATKSPSPISTSHSTKAASSTANSETSKAKQPSTSETQACSPIPTSSGLEPSSTVEQSTPQEPATTLDLSTTLDSPTTLDPSTPEKPTTPLTEFHLFKKLPLEVRCMIWKFSLPGPRIIELAYHKKDDNNKGVILSIDRNKLLPTIKVNYEARQVLVASYVAMRMPEPEFSSCTYFNPEKDIIYLSTAFVKASMEGLLRGPGKPFEADSEAMRRLFQAQKLRERVQRLAISNDIYSEMSACRWNRNESEVPSWWPKFGRLRELLILRQHPEGPGCVDDYEEKGFENGILVPSHPDDSGMPLPDTARFQRDLAWTSKLCDIAPKMVFVMPRNTSYSLPN